ncbi:MAG: cytochrome C [Chloroflexi bacterium]|nr:MAG: cytochrome C [Chloroflexota bacterium]
MNKRKFASVLLASAIGIFAVIQLIPFGRNHTNPPIVSEPQWSSPEARALVKERCFQCHSNETEWPWYSNIAPGSWLIAWDVNRGRNKFNFSEWENHPEELEEMIDEIEEGKMPPIQYWIVHPEARMDEGQKQELINALQSSIPEGGSHD